MEIPGQYAHYGKPQPDLHIKIKNFDGFLLVMGSIRKPKRLKIRGSDEREYPFLVKGGEDLRQDERIQQIFKVMNDIMMADPACCQRNLHLTTYAVIPLTPKVKRTERVGGTGVVGAMYRWKDGGMDRRIDGEMDRRIDGEMDRWIDGEMYRWIRDIEIEGERRVYGELTTFPCISFLL